MAKFIKKIGRVTVRKAEKDDPIYQEGWTIGPVSPLGKKATDNTLKEVMEDPPNRKDE